jgi:hypothetical protein
MRRALVLAITAAAAIPVPSLAAQQDDPPYLRDRGPGIPTSMFGTYVRRGQWLLYPFLEYYSDHDMEYKPAELGYGLDQDFRGEYHATEGLLFVSYGVTDWLAFELEAAVITAQLDKSPDDTSAMPASIEESGLGDVEGQLRVRWMKESPTRPELFSYFEAVAPVQQAKPLIGTQNWELKAGVGVIKGYRWGTVTARFAVEYDLASESAFDVGEYALEYLRRLSPAWRVYVGVEGTQDELELITEVQWHFSRSMFLKLNNALGLTSKATDWAPEVGVMISFPAR